MPSKSSLSQLALLLAFGAYPLGCSDDDSSSGNPTDGGHTGGTGPGVAGGGPNGESGAGGNSDGQNAGPGGAAGHGGQSTAPEPEVIDDAPVSCDAPADAGNFTFVKIATWKDDATAAYSMIHDDMCGPALRGIQELAVPQLEAHNLTAALGPFVDACNTANLWDVVREAEAKGNEIVNHSYSHPNITLENAAHEVAAAKAAMDAEVKTPVEFYIFPYDYWTPETLQAVGNAGHIGARAGNRDDNDGFDNPPLNPTSPTNDLEIEFDVWPRTYSKYASFIEKDILSVHVWNAVEKGEWAVREFHSVSKDSRPPLDGSQGFGPVPVGVYGEHLNFLVNMWRAGKVWTATPSTVIRYRRARTACTASVSGNTIQFGAPSADCAKYHTPLSVIVHTANDVESLTAVQGDAKLKTRKLAESTFSVNADPSLGDVHLAGCAETGPFVDASIQLPEKPVPADSVCDLRTVVGDGSDGKMDDLERDTETLQVFPNPAQRDGRDGSWAWYPGATSVEITDSDGSRALRFSGSGLNAWAGATLAFLGGNGAGACYDAAAYQGLRFKIHGNVESSDTLNGKVVVSLVSAETQTRTYGGDLDGEGGHFHKIVDVTDTPTVVSIAWGDLSPPTWGDSTQFSAFALGKLQAIDWGISDAASRFELYIDDIELF